VVLQKGPVNLTPTQLSLYNGTDPSLPIYLAINGTIFDVSANRGIYGPGGGYNFFAGRDATRAFVTGCFREDLTPDLDGVEEMYIPVEDDEETNQEEKALLSSRERKLRREREVREAKAKVRAQVEHWEGFFRNHDKYFEVGKVIVDIAEDEEEDGAPKSKSKPKRPLCEAAKKNRPKRKDLKGNK
jgi:predicted heme/steroid binding protein